jgi:regulatory protein
MTITALTPQKRRPHRTSVFLDEKFAFGMDNADLVKYNLAVGMEITKEQLNGLLKQVLCIRARDAALRFVASRPRSSHEVVKRLEADGYPPAIINYVIKRMVQYRYINDGEFSAAYAASRLRQGYGRFRVRQELRRKGIEDACIEAALVQPEGDDIKNITEWLIRKRIDPSSLNEPKKRKRCIDALMRRGFSYHAVKEALDNTDNY